MVQEQPPVDKHQVYVNGHVYTLYIAYQDQPELPEKFNTMTHSFWSFDFEKYYQSGYWDNSCQLYSLFDKDKIVAHITASLLLQVGITNPEPCCR